MHQRRLYHASVGIATIFIIGVTGYCWIEDWSILDAVFMTMITLSTVGYGSPDALGPIGQSFTVLINLVCLVGIAIWTAFLTSYVVENDLNGRFLKRRMMSMIAKLQDHTIVCGGGLLSAAIVERLASQNRPTVLVSANQDEHQILQSRLPELHVVLGLPTDELVLCEANLLSAANVVAVTDSDIDNLLIAITARDVGRDVCVHAYCNDPTIANRMRKAGVDEIVSPLQLAGDKIASSILNGDPVTTSC